MSINLKAILVIATTFVAFVADAQTDSLRRTRTNAIDKFRAKAEEKVDSMRLLRYSLRNIYAKDSFEIKGLHRNFHQYDPARNRAFDYGNLGNMGSAAYPTMLDLTMRKGFRLGYSQYQLYQKTEEDIRHFDQVRPFTELYFSGGETQSDLKVGGLFTRSFANDVNWVIDYDRIAQLGEYENQAVKQTSFLTSLAYRGNKRISAFLSYLINSSVENINGGVVDLSTLDLPVNDIRQNVSVNSTDATTRLQNQSIIFNAFYKLGSDSITSNFKNSLQYQVQSYNEFFRYTDASTASDSAFYQNYYISDRGIRNYNELARIRNGIYLNSVYKDYFQFKTGLIYDYNTVDLSGFNDGFSEVYLVFDGSAQLRKRLALEVNFFYGLLDVANEFGLDADAQLSITKNMGFTFGFDASRYGVDYNRERVYINQEEFYNYDFDPVLLQALKAEYYNKKWNLKIGGKIQNLFNSVYFDSSSLPSQDPGLYSVSVIYGIYDFKFKRLLLENSAYLQRQNKRHLNVPTVFTKNSISYFGKIFKDKMLLKAGFDFRYIVSETLPYYNPIIGQFYLNDSETYTPYPMLDARISFKVSSFTTFVKYENLTSFLRNDVEQTVQNYPQFDARFRFGIQWNLWN